MEPQPPTGLNFFISWGILEWILATISAGLTALATWVFGLALKLNGLGVGTEVLEKQLNDAKLEIRALKEQLDTMREELPSRSFIENQLHQLTTRIDRLIDSKLGSR